MAKQVCSICGQELNMSIAKFKLKDGIICGKCLTKAGIPIDRDSKKDCANKCVADFSDLANAIETDVAQKQDSLSQFKPTNVIGSRFKFDDNDELMLLAPRIKITSYGENDFDIIRYDQIAEYELLENGSSKAKGGLGMAVVGAVTFGAAGAIVGSNIGGKKNKNVCNSLRIKLTLRDAVNSSYTIDLITSPTKQDSPLYNGNYSIAQELLSKFKLITEANGEQPQIDSKVASADEIRKYKELLDDGIITQDEFDMKKKELLGL